MTKVVVLGAGPGGVAAAIRAAQLGAEVKIVEAGRVGGMCMNRGCVPLRVLGSAAEAAGLIDRAAEFGLKANRAEFDWARLKARVADTVAYVRLGTEALLRSHGVEIISGRGRLVAAGGVEVEGQILAAEAVILAVGAAWRRPEIPGAELKEVITSEEIIQELNLPRRLLVLGGRPWAVELAALCQRFGSQVTLAVPDRFLPEVDRQISSRLRSVLKNQGLTVLTPAEATKMNKRSGEVEVKLKVKGQDEIVVVDKVLVTARSPRSEGLGLEAAGVRVAQGAVVVDEHLRTSHPRIWAVGDLIGEPLLSHKASAQGVIAAENALGAGQVFDPSAVPIVLYTQPEAAAVGLSEKEAKARGLEVVTGEMPYGVNARALAELTPDGFVKVVCGAEGLEVLGVHVLGPQSAELITQAVLALKLEATADELAELIAPHPSFAEALVDAARMVRGGALYVPKQSA